MGKHEECWLGATIAQSVIYIEFVLSMHIYNKKMDERLLAVLSSLARLELGNINTEYA